MHDERAHVFRENYSEALSDYHQSAFTYGRKKITQDLDLMLSFLKSGSQILDVGCGTGYFMNYLSRRGFAVSGVDLSLEMIRQLREVYGDYHVYVADAKNLPFSDQCFDAVISIETLRYFKDRNVMLKEIVRVLKPGGRAFITAAPLFSGNLYGLYNVLCQKLKLRQWVSCYQSFETQNSFRVFLEQAGFSDISIQGRFFGPYFLLDKLCPNISQMLMKKCESADDRLSEKMCLRNFANHLAAVVKKPFEK